MWSRSWSPLTVLIACILLGLWVAVRYHNPIYGVAGVLIGAVAATVWVLARDARRRAATCACTCGHCCVHGAKPA